MKEFLRFTVFVMSQFTRCFTFSACTCEGLKRRLFQLLIFFFSCLYLVETEAEAQILYASVYMKL